MIAYLTGRWHGGALLTAAGVGYDVETAAAPVDGQEVQLWVHTHITDASQALYGFAAQADRSAFRALLKVQGVGPKVAMALLRDVGAGTLAAAVAAKDAKPLTKAAGVGLKVAERIVAAVDGSSLGPASEDGPVDELLELLTGEQMGFERALAMRALAHARAEHPDDPETALRVAMVACARPDTLTV